MAGAVKPLLERQAGRKNDAGKDPWDLLPWGPVQDIVRVLEHGARKYEPENWRKVPNARRRYFAAMMRHLLAWWRGERLDPDSGLPHLACAGCSLLFLAAFDQEGERLAAGPVEGGEDQVVHATGMERAP
jgi:hypothetical protein